MKLAIWFLKLPILLGGKNFARKALVDLSQVVMHPEDNKCNQALTLSANEKGNRRRQIASMETPLGLAYQKRTERSRFVSSKGVSPNWDYCTVNMSAGLSSKLLASTVGRAMLEAIPWTIRVTKSQRIFLWSPPPPAMFVRFLLSLHICSWTLCFSLRRRKVLSILGWGSYKIGLRINQNNSCKHYHEH